jgi:hypothetical protein
MLRGVNTRNQLICLHLTIPFVLLVGVGGFVLAGFLPPPSPGLSEADTAALFTPDNYAMRIGVSLLAGGSALFMGPAVAFRCQLRRIEGKFTALADLQMLSAAVGVLALQFPAYMWLAVSFRPGIPAEIVTVIVNLAFFLLLAAYSPAVLQNASIGLCILGARPGDVQPYPRWLGYANLWLAITLLPGILVPFFTSGPFTYGGIFGFWIVATGFFCWVVLMWWFTLKAIKAQAAGVAEGAGAP